MVLLLIRFPRVLILLGPPTIPQLLRRTPSGNLDRLSQNKQQETAYQALDSIFLSFTFIPCFPPLFCLARHYLVVGGGSSARVSTTALHWTLHIFHTLVSWIEEPSHAVTCGGCRLGGGE